MALKRITRNRRTKGKRQTLTLLLSLFLLLSGCGIQSGPQRYTKTCLDVFDTVTTIVGYSDSQADFEAAAGTVQTSLQEYHRLFDIYNEYAGMNNLKTVNDQAGIAPVQVDEKIIALLQDCKEYYKLTGGKVNVALGGVLKIWHEARETALDDPEQAYVPEEELLAAAAEHAALDAVILDEAAGTVYISDTSVQLDVGAVAKGWAVQRVAEACPAGFLISVGGNVCATGPKPGDESWVVGVQDPEGGEDYLRTLDLNQGSVVTSGDYQRCYTVDGTLYHHIIDPETLYPGAYWRSVTVVCQDSGLADALSTALFLMSREDGENLLSQWGGDAMWVDAEGNILYSDGFAALTQE